MNEMQKNTFSISENPYKSDREQIPSDKNLIRV